MNRAARLLTLLIVTSALLVAWAPPAGALAPAGGAFFWQSPQPFGWRVSQLTFAGVTDVWGLCGESRLAHSDDAGLTWSAVELGVTGDIWSLGFTDALHGRARLYDPDTSRTHLLFTDDGGATWDTRPLSTDLREVSLTFATPDVGWCIGYGKDAEGHSVGVVEKTVDAGLTWTRTVLPGSGYPEDVVAIDVDHVWVTRPSRGVLISSDGGATWTLHRLPPRAHLEGFAAADADSAWALVFGGPWPRETVLRTDDGAATWTKKAVFPSGAWGTLAARDADTAMLSVRQWSTTSGESAFIQRTSDGGATWQRGYVGPEAPSWLAYGPGALVVGWGGGLWRSTDGGALWTEVAAGDTGRQLYDVAVAGAGAWAVGGKSMVLNSYSEDTRGLIMHTADGVTWHEAELPYGSSLQAIAFGDASHGWAVGSRRLLQTTDGGGSWAAVNDGPSLELHAVAAAGDSAAIVLGWDWDTDMEQNVIAWTTDGGASWETETRGEEASLGAVAIVGPGHWLVGESTYVSGEPQAFLLETVDSGTTWTRRALDVTGYCQDIVFIDHTRGWLLASEAVGRFGGGGTSTVLRTSDGGATWSKTALNADLTGYTGLSSLAFADALRGWAVGGKVLVTSDGGATWLDSGAEGRSVYGRMPMPSFDAAATDGTDVWAVGPYDTVLSTRDTTADTAPPVTHDDGDRLWHNEDVTVRLTPFDFGDGVARTEYQIDGSTVWWTGAEIVFGAPLDHVGDGRHWLTYRSVDAAGNVESARRCEVLVDTVEPETGVRAARHVRRGERRVVRVVFRDELSPYGRLTLRLGKWHGAEFRTLRSIRVGLVKRDRWVAVRVRFNVPPGTYSLVATAKDLAGNEGGWYGRVVKVE